MTLTEKETPGMYQSLMSLASRDWVSATMEIIYYLAQTAKFPKMDPFARRQTAWLVGKMIESRAALSTIDPVIQHSVFHLARVLVDHEKIPDLRQKEERLLEMEAKLRFIHEKVKDPLHFTFIERFRRKYIPPESDSFYSDVVRFICTLITPNAALMQSSVVKRWRSITAILQGIRACKLAIYFDWLFSNPDNLIPALLEPGLSILLGNGQLHPKLTASMVEFLCDSAAKVWPDNQPRVYHCINAAMQKAMEPDVTFTTNHLAFNLAAGDIPAAQLPLLEPAREASPSYPMRFLETSNGGLGKPNPESHSTWANESGDKNLADGVSAADADDADNDDGTSTADAMQSYDALLDDLDDDAALLDLDDAGVEANVFPDRRAASEADADIGSKPDGADDAVVKDEMDDAVPLQRPLSEFDLEQLQAGGPDVANVSATLRNLLTRAYEQADDRVFEEARQELETISQRDRLAIPFVLVLELGIDLPQLQGDSSSESLWLVAYGRDELFPALQAIAAVDPDWFYQLLPRALSRFSDELVGLPELVHLAVRMIDASKLLRLKLVIQLESLRLFGSDPACVLAATVEWTSIEQWAAWDLLAAEIGAPARCAADREFAITAAVALSHCYDDRAEIRLGLLACLSRTPPSGALLRTLLLGLSTAPDLVCAALCHWQAVLPPELVQTALVDALAPLSADRAGGAASSDEDDDRGANGAGACVKVGDDDTESGHDALHAAVIRQIQRFERATSRQQLHIINSRRVQTALKRLHASIN
nr:Integrator complex subunit 3 [Polyrhizophydium stewartii]